MSDGCAGKNYQSGNAKVIIKAREVVIDLFTGSGTSAMSSEQWAGQPLITPNHPARQAKNRFSCRGSAS